ncbi:DNA photolyase, FAD-binding/Cryptochrome, C-terminal, partial [Cynara cardunculus var. scolymus]
MRLSSRSLSSSHCHCCSTPFSFSSFNRYPKMKSGSNTLMWFRKGLRIHDNPALEYAAKSSTYVYPIFVIDPHYMKPDPDAFSPGSKLAGLNRIRFLLESLLDLDSSLKKFGSRLLVLHGEPSDVVIRCLKEWDVKRLCFEYDTDPYYQALDGKVTNYASESGIEIFSPVSHTLFHPAEIIQKNGGKPPLSYQSFLKLAGDPHWSSSPLCTTLPMIPPIGDTRNCEVSEVPTEWVAKFEKPKGDPSAFIKPATTMLSPYLKVLLPVHSRGSKRGQKPHLSTNFPYWAAAWRDARTGFPWIDAIMVQLRKWGWIHHLARHSVACFLTRGDLFVHWEKGRNVFERLLIDSDWAINNGNWLWLSCSSFFYQYNRIYSPISFGKKYDPSGAYIRHFLPVLKDMPKEYIYEPWTAPLSIQTKAKCIVGKDYPKPGQFNLQASAYQLLFVYLNQNQTNQVCPVNPSWRPRWRW